MQRIIIDVREPYEFASGHIKDALNIPLGEVLEDASAMDGIPRGAKIILYCNSGSRSSVAGSVFRSKGYKNVSVCVNQDHVKEIYGTD